MVFELACLTLKLRSHDHMVQKWFRIEISEIDGWINFKLYRHVAGTMAMNLFHKNFGKIYYRPWLVKFEYVTFFNVLAKLNFHSFDLYEIAASVFYNETLPNDVSIASLLSLTKALYFRADSWTWKFFTLLYHFST